MQTDLQQSFQKTIRALGTGQLSEATEHAQSMLSSHPDHPEVQHIAAVVAYESGDIEAAEELFDRAQRAAPENPEILFNLGSARLKAGDHDGAKQAFDACLGLNPRHDGALVNRGNVHRRLNDNESAASDYRLALSCNPRHAGAMVNLGNIALDNDPEEALQWFEKALRLSPSMATAVRGRGQARLQLGRPVDGLEDLQRAAQYLADDPATYSALGRACTQCLRLDEAVAAYTRVIELEPDNPSAWNDLGTAYTGKGSLQAAENAFRRAMALDSRQREAAENLAALLELANRDAEALELVAQTRKTNGDSTALCLVEARCAARGCNFEKALATLDAIENLSEPRMRKDYCFLRGRIMDSLKRYADAFENYLEGNRISEEIWRKEGHPEDRFVAEISDIARCVQRSEFPPVAFTGRSPAFLMGFQRSGTTLIDTVLGTHDDVQVLEEQPVLSRTIADMTDMVGRYPQCLPHIGVADMERIRDRYFHHARTLGWQEDGRMLLDKSPLHTVHAGLIRMLFPRAPILFVLRHPLDVCLSCFMQDFTMNAFMTHFTTPEGVARVYQQVMTSWLDVRDRLEHPVHTIYYERLVRDPATQLRGIVDYLELPWDDTLLDHTRHARERGLINTPSYEQVTRPINRSAVNRWQRYAVPLEKAQTLLRPLIEEFGYDADGAVRARTGETQ